MGAADRARVADGGDGVKASGSFLKKEPKNFWSLGGCGGVSFQTSARFAAVSRTAANIAWPDAQGQALAQVNVLERFGGVAALLPIGLS